MKKYKVSVCVPVYNASKYLRECLDSLVNQTLKEIEIVCVNDGSTDNSLEILNDYSKKYNNFKIVTQDNQGLGGARNTGIANSSAEYIGFLDADDFAEPTMYEVLYNLATSNNADIAMCNLKFYPENVHTKKTIWFNSYDGEITGEFLNKNTQPWNKIVSKKLIDETNFKFFEKNGDGVFIILMLKANKIVSTNEKLHNYRIGHSSMSTNYKLQNFEISVDSAKEQLKLLESTKYKNELKEYFDYRMIYVLLQAITISALKKNKHKFMQYRNELYNLNYKENKYLKTILNTEFSKMKYLGIVYVLPKNYYISALLVKLVL